MTLKIILPSAKTDQINIKDAILGILGERFPLSIRDLFKIVNNEYNLKVTYQGVRKAVNYLEEANVLVKHELKYEIKREWIQNCDTDFNYKNIPGGGRHLLLHRRHLRGLGKRVRRSCGGQ